VTAIVCGSLVKAVRLESEIAVPHHWGVSPQTVWLWRKALGVGATTEGTSRLRRDHFAEPWGEAAEEKAWAKTRDPDRRAKIAAARWGKPTPGSRAVPFWYVQRAGWGLRSAILSGGALAAPQKSFEKAQGA
jgi:hypothetical protein